MVANKIDLDPSVTSKTFKFASERNLQFYFVSAADGTNVVKVKNINFKIYHLLDRAYKFK